MPSRYIIGIDLGTTNSAVACLDTAAADPVPEVVPMPQITAPGERDDRAALPSFVYLPDAGETAAGSLDLPWAAGRDFCVGTYARQMAAAVPGKTVSSAKSWLCAPNVDRLAPILPWQRGNPARQLSPVDAARLLLEHARDAWNACMADTGEPFDAQEVNLTVPASFDAVARDLTVQAARNAGIEVRLLEEPQAAFYAWLQSHAEAWRDQVEAGQRILVCDIGGGTTDFSLIEVADDGGNVALNRIAVGEHILLGGDNMDLTLAYAVAQRLRQEKGLKLDNYQLAGLTHACREAKETLCADPDAGPQRLTVLGRGSSLIANTISTDLTFAELEAVLLDGFFPACGLDEPPRERTGAGLRAFGLNYAADPAVTRHLAAFLSRHCADGRLPDAVLFNGGVTKAAVMRQRVVDALGGWRGEPVRVLTGDRPDLAVALGACWYGNVRRGNAIRIKAGSPHSYYVGIESTMPAVPGFAPPIEALCVVPFGLEEGTGVDVPYGGLGLVVGQTTEFRFFAATARQDDRPGQLLPDADGDDLHELPPLAATLDLDPDSNLPPGTLVPVTLRAELSEIGTMQLYCEEVGGNREWQLEYELRTTDTDGVSADPA